MDGYRPQVLHQYLRNAQNSSELLFVFPPHLSEDTVKSNKLVISSPPTQGKEKSEVKGSISKAVHFNSFKNKSEKGPWDADCECKTESSLYYSPKCTFFVKKEADISVQDQIACIYLY